MKRQGHSGKSAFSGFFRSCHIAVFTAFVAIVLSPQLAVAQDKKAPQTSKATSNTGYWRVNAQNTGVIANKSLPQTLKRSWVFSCSGPVIATPIVVNKSLYVGDSKGFVRCLNSETGTEVWKYKTEGAIEAPCFFKDGFIYVGSTDYQMYCLNAESGKLKWTFKADGKITGGATAINAMNESIKGQDKNKESTTIKAIAFGSHDNFVYAVREDNGQKLWQFETNNYVNGQPALTQSQNLVVGGCDGFLYVICAKDGKLARKVDLDSHIASTVAIDKGIAYVGHYGNKFEAVSVKDGKKLWLFRKRNFPYFAPAAVSKDWVVVGARDKRMHALNRNTGEQIWEFKLRKKLDSPPLIVGKEVVFGAGDGRVYILNLETGKKRWSYEIGQSILAGVAFNKDSIYVADESGKVYKFQKAK